MEFQLSNRSAVVPTQDQIDLTVPSVEDNYDSTGVDKINESESTPNKTTINQSTNSTISTHYHHRRKRSRISPVTRPNNTLSQSYSSLVESDLSYKDHTENTESTDEDSRVAVCNNEQLSESTSETTIPAASDISLATLKLTRLDPEFRDLISRYVRSEHIVRCLELAGFCTPYVLARLDETQLQRLEEFVSHACSMMKSVSLREYFTGPIFSHDPLQFKLPSGAVCGILLAVSEIRRKYRRYHTLPGVWNTVDVDINETCEPSFADVACQTDQTSLQLSTNLCQSVTTPESLVPIATVSSAGANSPKQNFCNAVSGDSISRSTQNSKVSDSPNTPVKQESVVEATSAGTVAMMAAALQVAAAVATCSAPNLPVSSVNLTTPLHSSDINCANSLSLISNPFASQLPVDQNNATHVSSGTNLSTNRLTTQSSATGTTQSATANQNSFTLNHSSITCGNGVFDDEAVDLERLKQHSSASAIRLASRQFVNAHLLRGRDFDMEMELSITPDGFKRVTGIFYCHLCREKRERTSAVRFSIARNRYPVLSNVLSHLKTHFHYRGQLLSGSQATQVLHPTNSLLKSANALTDSFMGTGLIHPTGTFGSQIASNYRTDLASEQTTATSTSFLSPSVFSSQIKPEPAAFPYPVDNEGAEDSSTSHTIFDNLSTSPPIHNLSSPNRKNSPSAGINHSNRSLGLDVGITSRQNTNGNNSCNTLAS